MKRFRALWVALFVTALPLSSEAQPCRTSCRVGERLVGGCCQQAAQPQPQPTQPPVHRPVQHNPAPAAPAASGCATGMVLIPAGAFWMGLPPGENTPSDESPEHRVSVAAFCMDRTEVTVSAYRTCEYAGGCAPLPTTAEDPENNTFTGYPAAVRRAFSAYCNANFANHGEHPANCVTWAQADAYCRWRTARLPTEPEWEFAARGTDRRRYPWGAAPPGPTRLNACGTECRAEISRLFPSDAAVPSDAVEWSDGYVGTAPVGSFPAGASPFGLLDMAGNVWERTGTRYAAYSSNTPPNARHHVTRGGGAMSLFPPNLRVSTTIRDDDSDTLRYPTVGFRCASDAPN